MAEDAGKTGGAGAPAKKSESAPQDPRDGVRNIFDSLLTAMEKAVDLRVMTVVTDFQITNFDEKDKEVRIVLDGDQKGLVTSINILTGDIKNIVHNDYQGAQNKEVRDLHQKNVELARDIVANNLKVLGELIEKFGGYLQERSERGDGT